MEMYTYLENSPKKITSVDRNTELAQARCNVGVSKENLHFDNQS